VRKPGIAIVMAAALGLAACGSSGPSSSAPTTPVQNGRAVVLASVVKTAAADSAKISLDMSFTGVGAGVTISADGAMDFASGDSEITMEFGNGGILGAILPSDVEARRVDGTAYVHIPDGLPAGKEWVAVPAGESAGSGSTALGIGSAASPAKILAYLEKVSDGVKEVGTETVRGVETTHSTAEIDLAKVVDRSDVPSALRDEIGKAAGDVGTVPVDIYIDGDGLLRREKLEMGFGSFLSGAGGASGASGNGSGVTMQLDLYDFGSPVEVEAPPADQVLSVGRDSRDPGVTDPSDAAA
jgi:hypothetical protein